MNLFSNADDDVWRDLSQWRRKIAKQTPPRPEETPPVRKPFEFDLNDATCVVGWSKWKAQESATPKKQTPAQKAQQEKEQGNAFFQRQQFDKAVLHYGKAIEYDPTVAVYYINRAMAYIKLKQFLAAEQDCTRGIELQPQNVKALWRRGMARRELGRMNDARQDFKKALSIEPGNKSIKEELAKLPVEQPKAVPSPAPAQPPTADKGKGKATPSPESAQKLKVNWPNSTGGKGKEKATASAQVAAPSESDRRRLPITVVDGFYEAQKDTISKAAPPSTAITPPSTTTIGPEKSKAAAVAVPVVHTQPAMPSKSSTPPITPLAPLKLKCPRTNMEFERDWKTCRVRGRETLYQYFKGISPKNYATLFRSSLESDQFEEILALLDTFYAERDSQEDIFAVLQGLSHVRRIDMLVMFLGSHEAQTLQRIFKRLGECIDDVQIRKLAKVYGVKV